MAVLPSIVASVGQGGANRPTDVLTIQSLLNLLPRQLGGACPKLAMDSWIGPKTIGAIRTFQKRHFGWDDGRVDAQQKTIGRLGELSLALTAGSARLLPETQGRLQMGFAGGTLPPDQRPWVLWLLRLLIINTALREAFPKPGKVSDQVTWPEDTDTRWPVKGPVRQGWETLMNYFQSAWGGMFNMADLGCRQGIKCPRHRVRASHEPKLDKEGNPNGIHWCGIFVTWVCQQALATLPDLPFARKRPLKCMPYKGITVPETKELRTNWRDIWPGDICVEVNHSHHFIALDVPGADGMVWSANGNSTASFSEIDPAGDRDGWYSQSILVKRKSVIGLQRVHSADDLLIW
jgi:hypothetical protein